MTLQDYAEETRDRLQETFERLSGQARRCRLRCAGRLDRLLR